MKMWLGYNFNDALRISITRVRLT